MRAIEAGQAVFSPFSSQDDPDIRERHQCGYRMTAAAKSVPDPIVFEIPRRLGCRIEFSGTIPEEAAPRGRKDLNDLSTA
jgi:hypothetical protein